MIYTHPTPHTAHLLGTISSIGSTCSLPSTIHSSSLPYNTSAPTSILPSAANFPYLSHTLSRSHTCTSSVRHHSDSPLPIGSAPPVISLNVVPHLTTPQVQYTSSVSGGSNFVQVVSATTRVTPTSHQTYTTCPVLQPTNYAGTQHGYTTVHCQSVGVPRHTSAYAAVQPQCVNEQIQAGGVQAYTQAYPTPYTTPQNTVYRGHTPSASTREIRTHSRALSHGQLSFNRQANTSGLSLPHISLEVSPSDNIGASLHSSQTISRSDTCSPIVGSYGFRRNSLQGGVNVQRSLSVSSGLGSNSTKHMDQLVSSSHSNNYLSSNLSTSASLSSIVHSTYSPNVSENVAASYQQNFSLSPPSVLTNQPPGIQVPLKPPMISTSRILPSTSTARSPSFIPAVSTNVTAPNGTSETTLPCEVSKQQSQGVPNIQPTSCPSSISRSASENKLPYRRGHARNHSLGNDLPRRGPLFSKGHTRNRSLGSISGPFQLSSRQPSLGNLSIASASSFITIVSFITVHNMH